MATTKPQPTPIPSARPAVHVPAVMLPGARDGEWILRPGKPVVIGDELTVAQAAKILGLSERRVQSMADEGNFKPGEWNQPSGPGGKIFLKRSAVLARKGIGQ